MATRKGGPHAHADAVARHRAVEATQAKATDYRKQLDAPPTRQVDRTFKRAPRAKTKVPTDQPLVFDGEPDVKARLPRRAKTVKANLRRKPKKKTG